VGGDEVFRKTLNGPSPLWSWPQLLWIRQNDPGRWEKTKHLLFQKDYVRHRLAPAHVSDTIDAAGSLLFDPVKNRWIIKFCNDLDVGSTALPKIFNSMEVVSRVNRQGMVKLASVGRLAVVSESPLTDPISGQDKNDRCLQFWLEIIIITRSTACTASH